MSKKQKQNKKCSCECHKNFVETDFSRSMGRWVCCVKCMKNHKGEYNKNGVIFGGERGEYQAIELQQNDNE